MSQNRIEWIDLVRAIAILTVLYIHATDGIYIISSDAIMNYTLFSRIFQFASLFIGRIGVPFFLMITGYLLLDRAYDDEKVRKFWTKNCKGLIIVTVLWSAIYAVSILYVSLFSTNVNTIEAGNLFFSHMWYMPMILGMYSLIPFFNLAFSKLNSKKVILLPLCLLFLSAMLFSDLNFVLPLFGLEDYYDYDENDIKYFFPIFTNKVFHTPSNFYIFSIIDLIIIQIT